jgi:hypothetical protein
MVSKTQRSLNALRDPLVYKRLEFRPSVSGDTPDAAAEQLWSRVLATVEQAVKDAGDKPHRIKISGYLRIYIVPPEVK